MNWEAVGAVAELLGAIGVIASLLYLSVQIRQNSRNIIGQSHVALTEATQRLLSELRTNPDIAEMNIRISNDWKNAKNASEERIITWWNLDEALINELAFQLWQQGTIDDATYKAKEDYFLSVLLMPGKRTWWDNYRYYLSSKFIDRINSKLEEIDAMDISDIRNRMPMYNAGVSE